MGIAGHFSDGAKAWARTEEARVWCRHYGCNVEKSFMYNKWGHVAAHIFCAHWCKLHTFYMEQFLLANEAYATFEYDGSTSYAPDEDIKDLADPTNGHDLIIQNMARTLMQLRPRRNAGL